MLEDRGAQRREREFIRDEAMHEEHFLGSWLGEDVERNTAEMEKVNR